MNMQEYQVWDRTTRWFHWINVLCVLGLIAIGTVILNAGTLGVTDGGKILLKTVHVYVGYVLVLNLLWRLVWGFIGGPYARWRAILPLGHGYGAELKTELSTLASRRHGLYLGHSPLGRLAVTLVLLALLVQACTGLILAGTDIYMPPFGDYFAEWVKAEGLTAQQVLPYAPATVDEEAYQEMRAFRSPVADTHLFLYFTLLGLITLHIVAVVLTELLHGGNIISAMFTGRKTLAVRPQDSNQR